MKNLIDYINESIENATKSINEDFQSSILNDFFLDAKNKLTSRRPMPMLVVNSMKWKEMTNDDVAILTPEEAYQRIYSRSSESTEFFVWSLKDGYMVVSVGKDLVANFAGFSYNTVKALYKSGEVKSVLEVKDWRRFDSMFLRELRRQQNSNSKMLKADLEVATKTDDYYDKIFNDKDIAMFSDVTEKVRMIIDAYKALLKYITDNKAELGPVWSYKICTKFQKIAEGIEEVMLMVKEIQPGVNSTESKNAIMTKGNEVMTLINKFDEFIKEFVTEAE